MMKTIFLHIYVRSCLGLMGVLVVAGCEGFPTGSSMVIDDKAKALLTGMSDRLSASQEMTLRSSRVTDRALAEHLAVPTRATVEVMVSAPNRFRAEIKEPGSTQSVYFDGMTLSLFHHGEKFYASERVGRPTIGGALDAIEARYGFMPPLADFIVVNPYDSLTKHMKSGRYVGTETIGGVKCHHIAASGEDVDWDLWLREGDLLPRRYVVTANVIEGRPEWRTDFLSWDLAGEFPEGYFTFTPPAGAEEIPMMREGEELEEISIRGRGMQEEPGSL